MEFIKNELINKALDEYYQTFSHTLDTNDFVPEKFNDKISKYIYKNMNKKFKQIDIFYLLILEDMGVKLDLFQKLQIAFSGLRGLYKETKGRVFEDIEIPLQQSEVVKEIAESEQSERIKNVSDLCSAFDNRTKREP